jgi:hypothetical protein
MRRHLLTVIAGLVLAAGAASCGDDERGGVEVQGGTTGTTGATTGTTPSTETSPSTTPKTTPTTP